MGEGGRSPGEGLYKVETKEPSPALRAPSPMLRTGEGNEIHERPITAQVYPATLSLARTFMLSLLSCPQAAMMSRPRGVRTGLA
jgi:hypothetical protein